jgi:dTDP-4-dehydrorhamnose 3,5-epimerase
VSRFRRLPTEIEEVALIEPTVHGDERGFFVETFRANEFAELGVGLEFVQENHSRSGARVLRGIHVQPDQAKLVRCVAGRIFDVAVDLRPDSPTYKRWEGYELDDVDHRQLLIPAGFGHGFCVLSDAADAVYRVSSYYDPELEWGVAWDDPEIAVDWPIREPVLSERDQSAPTLAELTASGTHR